MKLIIFYVRRIILLKKINFTLDESLILEKVRDNIVGYLEERFEKLFIL